MYLVEGICVTCPVELDIMLVAKGQVVLCISDLHCHAVRPISDRISRRKEFKQMKQWMKERNWSHYTLNELKI